MLNINFLMTLSFSFYFQFWDYKEKWSHLTRA